jgi:hypothetical protein
MNCKFPYHNKDKCLKKAIKNKNFCKIHMYYETKINLDDIKWCNKHNKTPLLNNECSHCNKELEKIKNKILCKGITIKNNNCNFSPLENSEYCSLHQTYKKWKELIDSGKKICTNWIRGCWSEINDDFNRCLECREKERNNDKILRIKKREDAIIFNSINSDIKMCKDCNDITDKLFNSCCFTCYKIKYNSIKKRAPRESFNQRLYYYKCNALKRNLVWNLEDETAINFMKQNCYYCNYKYIINGIDRINSNKGYFIDNCVSCCFQCNSMKERKSINDFLDICEHIVSYNKLFKGQLNNNLFEKSEHQTFSKYKYNANKRGIIFNISQEEFNKLFKMKCTYCGSFLEGCNGIDRINSNKGYFSENCTPCCKICNFMKLDYTKDQFIEKCLMITYKKYNMIYKINDLNTEKDKLIKMFQNIEYVKETLNEDFKYLKDESYYKNLIWNYPLTNIQNIKIKLVFATSPELMDIWYFYRNNVSSIPFQKNSKLVGRVIYILVKDKITDKYLGIMSLSSDIMHLEDRDDYIGWTHNNKVINKKINYLMNLSTCVSLQPFGFNFNGGKLLTKLAFSKEISDFYQEKYNQPLLGITTTGLYGKSIQYDRLKELKFVGYTKGNSTYKIPSDIIEQCKLYLMSLGKNYSKKLFIISQTLKELGLDKKDYMSDNQKGIYFGFCHPQAKKFLCEEIDNLIDYTPNLSKTIFKDWLNKWGIKRYNHLIETKRFITSCVDSKEINTKKEYFQKYYQEKKAEKEKYIIIPTDKLILPLNITTYEEKNTYYIQYNKTIEGKRYTVRKKIISNNLEENLNNLVMAIKEKFPDLILPEMKSYNSELFKPIKEEQINIKNDTPKEIKLLEEKIMKAKKEYFQKRYQEKKLEKEKDLIIHSDKLILPQNITKYEEKGVYYIAFNKNIDAVRYSLKQKIVSNDIQKNLDNLIISLKKKYLNIEIPEMKILNPHLFKPFKEEQKVDENKIIQKPVLPKNFSICTINNIDYIQYCKKIDNQKYQYKIKINSYNLQNVINSFVDNINNKYKLNIPNQTIENPQNWKTTNKILNKEPSEEKQKSISRQTKYLEKKKAELGDETFKALKAKQARERREKKKQEIDL